MNSGDAFEQLIQRMPVGLVVYQLDDDLETLRVVCANRAASSLVGLDFDKHLGASIGELFPGTSKERQLRYVELARSAPTQQSMVRFEDARFGNTTFSIRAFAMPERCVGVVFQDLAEQVAELARREERFRALLENSDDAIVMTNAGGELLYVSPSVTRVSGHSPEELISQDGFLMTHEEDTSRVRAIFAQALANPGVPFPHELRTRHVDGSWRLLEVTTVNRLEDPNVGAVVANLRDITERRRIEDALRKTEEQLRLAQKMEAIGQLAAGVAHDFNNLLSVVLSYAHLLLGDESLSSGHTEIEQIKKAGERAADLTRQLLAFSRQQVLEPKIVDLNGTVLDMEVMLRTLVGEDIELRVVPARDLWRVSVDPGQLEQVLMNLVVNARDAMQGGGILTIETGNIVLDQSYANSHLGVLPGPHAMLAVSDSGSGIDKAVQERIFEPFFTTKEQGKGTGLGLSTVFGIVKQSGGSIWVYSEPGKGTTFKVYFPQKLAEASKARSSERPHDAPAGGNETILLVEDDSEVRAVTRAILAKQGYRVLEAAVGAEALKLAETALPIDLLLTDVVMPKMSGRELAEKLMATRPTLKVLYVSGYTDSTIVHHGVLDEGVAFLQKPITPMVLARKVREVLD